MTDREMLELAAKAAGIEIAWTDDVWGAPELPPYMHLPGGQLWNPLTDDGDRYRLARACGLRIDFHQGMVCGENLCVLGCWCPEDEKEEARTIVQAAAGIGRRMP